MIIIFIPAKGYSERVKLKNSRKIDGSSLVERALEFAKKINLVSKIGGIILLITGILIVTNQLQALGYYLLDVLPFLQNFG